MKDEKVVPLVDMPEGNIVEVMDKMSKASSEANLEMISRLIDIMKIYVRALLLSNKEQGIMIDNVIKYFLVEMKESSHYNNLEDILYRYLPKDESE